MIARYILLIKKLKKDKIEQETLGFIANGNLYTFGKDKNEHSVLNISFRSKIRTTELKEFFGLVQLISIIFRNKACVPFFLERFSFLIDLTDFKCSMIFLKKVKKIQFLFFSSFV